VRPKKVVVSWGLNDRKDQPWKMGGRTFQAEGRETARARMSLTCSKSQEPVWLESGGPGKNGGLKGYSQSNDGALASMERSLDFIFKYKEKQ
jgi:hypothetical protein